MDVTDKMKFGISFQKTLSLSDDFIFKFFNYKPYTDIHINYIWKIFIFS